MVDELSFSAELVSIADQLDAKRAEVDKLPKEDQAHITALLCTMRASIMDPVVGEPWRYALQLMILELESEREFAQSSANATDALTDTGGSVGNDAATDTNDVSNNNDSTAMGSDALSKSGSSSNK